jgi:hypothetical protein
MKPILWIAGIILFAWGSLFLMGDGRTTHTRGQASYTKGETSYINRDGERKNIPGQSSDGATARCRNGLWSYSKNRQGTCSQEGGVDYWVK